LVCIGFLLVERVLSVNKTLSHEVKTDAFSLSQNLYGLIALQLKHE